MPRVHRPRGRESTKYVGLPAADYDCLSEIAVDNGVSIAAVARTAVVDWLVRKGYRERPKPPDFRKNGAPA